MKKLLLVFLSCFIPAIHAMDDMVPPSAILFQVSDIPFKPLKESFVDKVERDGRYAGCVIQTDHYLRKRRHPYKPNKEGIIDPPSILRVREEESMDDSSCMAFVTSSKKDTSGKTECETIPIDDAQRMLRVFELQSYNDYLQITKRRRQYLYTHNGVEFTISFDTVYPDPDRMSTREEKFYKVSLKSRVDTIEEGDRTLRKLLIFFGFSRIKRFDR